MKFKTLLLTCVILINFACSQKVKNSGIEETKNYSVSDVKKLKVRNAFEVELIYSDKSIVEISADKNIIPFIEVINQNGELKIGLKENIKMQNYKTIKAKVYINSLPNIDLSGASSLKITKTFKKVSKHELNISGASSFEGNILADELNIDLSGASNSKILNESNILKTKISGASDLKIEGIFENSTFNISGASKINIVGKTNILNVNTSGASSFRGKDLISEIANIESSGASDVIINVTNILNANASGASSIKYYGNIKNIQQKSSGSSSIKKIN